MPDRSAEPVVVEPQLAPAAKSQRSLDLEVASELSDDVAPMAEQHRQKRIGRKGTSKKPRRRRDISRAAATRHQPLPQGRALSVTRGLLIATPRMLADHKARGADLEQLLAQLAQRLHADSGRRASRDRDNRKSLE